ncbi:thioredoxin family protein [Sphingomonas sp. SUN039]|uniref:thioredoxin family protein n=1 Tax=Sphingomonas sp. SUN039 TaxID=2937787 RepID=UPI00216495C6|nr:thioredoxin family protein [Sphingomonas sp. SUN039]UVO53103.1 thioredoxin family protein [Sphingomonas sp. SUN039]
MLRMSRMLERGTQAPDFSLPDTGGVLRTLADVRGDKGLVVAFICNHCPFVLHLIDHFAASARDWQARGLGVVAISSNDTAEFPEDGADFMPAFARERGLSFPYLHDADQRAALAYEAICTPDFFLFDGDLKLFYAGQYDSSRPKIDRPPVPGLPPLRHDLPVTGEDLQRAVDALLAGEAPPTDQRPSAGCSIKWLPENEPSWA